VDLGLITSQSVTFNTKSRKFLIRFLRADFELLFFAQQVGIKRVKKNN